MSKSNKKQIVRKGWVIRITDKRGCVYFPIFKSIYEVEIERQNDEFNNVVPYLSVFATKEIAQSRVADIREAAVKAADRRNLFTHPELPVKVEPVRYMLTIG